MRRAGALACGTAWAGALAVSASFALAGSAAACPLCQAVGSESLKAYIGPTILLSAVPVAILGSIALWLWRAGRRTAAIPVDSETGIAR